MIATPVFDQKYVGTVELNTKRGQMAFNSIDVARWRIVHLILGQHRVTVSMLAKLANYVFLLNWFVSRLGIDYYVSLSLGTSGIKMNKCL
jgi:hypothetical protein